MFAWRKIIYVFVETPCDFIIAKLSIRKPISSSVDDEALQ
jgi:hypothetical protein